MQTRATDCIHGIDIMWPCFVCQSEVRQITREYTMQTSGTFPQLNDKSSVTRPGKACKGGKGKKR